MRLLHCIVGAAAFACGACSAYGQSWPAKPIRIMIRDGVGKYAAVVKAAGVKAE